MLRHQCTDEGVPLEAMPTPRDERRDEKVSLDPLTPEEALRGLLAVDPDDDAEPADDEGEPQS